MAIFMHQWIRIGYLGTVGIVFLSVYPLFCSVETIYDRNAQQCILT
jgi:hypothetical protein